MGLELKVKVPAGWKGERGQDEKNENKELFHCKI
jgi:hypothetical protein